MTKKIVFIDRDGVINKDSSYVNKIEDFEFIFAAPNAIKKLNNKNIPVIIITNQSGIERGYMTEQRFIEIMNHMENLLKGFGAKIDDYYYCPYIESNDRKPSPGMILKALKNMGINKSNIKDYKLYMIGDRLTDIESGNRANCTTLLVQTGAGMDEYKKIKNMISTPDKVVYDINKAVNYILQDN